MDSIAEDLKEKTESLLTVEKFFKDKLANFEQFKVCIFHGFIKATGIIFYRKFDCSFSLVLHYISFVAENRFSYCEMDHCYPNF